MVEFLLALVEFDRRRLYLDLGYNSLWKFCLEGLHLGEGATNLRTRAVGLLQRFPSLAEPLRDGRLTLSTLCEIGKVLSEENLEGLIARAAWKTREEAEEIVASLRPKVAVSEGLFRAPELPSTRAPSPPVIVDEPDTDPPVAAAAPMPETKGPISVRYKPRALEPVSANRWRFRALVSSATRGKLLAAQYLAASTVGMNWDDVLRAMAEAYIEKVEKRVAKKTDQPRKPKCAPKDDGTICAEVRRLVWERDEGQCSWIGPDGHRCGERRYLQYDHIIPRAQGGTSTLENVRLLCSAHNQHHADQTLGREFMEKKRRTSTNARMGDRASARADSITEQPREKQATETLQSQLDFSGSQ